MHGHTAVGNGGPNRINIDTGAYATGKRTCLVLQGEDMPFIFTIVDKAALAYTIIKPAPVRQPQRQGDLLGSRRDAISETPPDPEEARIEFTLFAHAMPNGPTRRKI